jgi:hypothetical protein
MRATGSSHYVFPFVVPQAVSASYIRMPISANIYSNEWVYTWNSTIATGTTVSSSFTDWNTFNAVIFTQNIGASSRSLALIASGSAGWTLAFVAAAPNWGKAGRSYSISQSITFPSEGANTANTTYSYSTGYSANSSSGSVFNYSTNFANFTGWRNMDIPFATSLSAGNYWMAINHKTSNSGDAFTSAANATMFIGMTNIVLSQTNQAIGNFNAATNSSLQLQIGLGSWSTNAIQTTASIALANISSVASQLRPYFQMVRQA